MNCKRSIQTVSAVLMLVLLGAATVLAALPPRGGANDQQTYARKGEPVNPIEARKGDPVNPIE